MFACFVLCQSELKALGSGRLWYPTLLGDLGLSGFKGSGREWCSETSQSSPDLTSWVQSSCQSSPWGACSRFAPEWLLPLPPPPWSPAAILSIDHLLSRALSSAFGPEFCTSHIGLWVLTFEALGWRGRRCPVTLPQGLLTAFTQELQCSSYHTQSILPPCFDHAK